MAALIEQSVLLQSENLWSHAAVAEGLAAESLEVHGWLYDIESGDARIITRCTRCTRCWDVLFGFSDRCYLSPKRTGTVNMPTGCSP